MAYCFSKTSYVLPQSKREILSLVSRAILVAEVGKCCITKLQCGQIRLPWLFSRTLLYGDRISKVCAFQRTRLACWLAQSVVLKISLCQVVRGSNKFEVKEEQGIVWEYLERTTSPFLRNRYDNKP